MASVRHNGDTSGFIEISAPSVAGSTTITLPATSGGDFLVTDSNGDLNVDSGTLFVDASTNRVGIGTTSPATTFVVDKSDASGLSAHILVNNSESSSGLSLLGAGSSFSSGGWPSLTDCGIIRSSANSSNGVAIQAPVGAISFWNSSEAARIDSSGRLLVGTISARTNINNESWSGNVALNVEGANAYGTAVNIVNNYNGNGYSFLNFLKSNTTSVGSNTIVSNGNTLGLITFQGNDGTEFVQAAAISAVVDTTPGTNDMPGRLSFATTADGASTPTERLRIASTGAFGLSGANYGTSGQVLTSQGSGSAPQWADRVSQTQGSYTPTTTATAGDFTTRTITHSSSAWTRVGDIVHVTGEFTVSPAMQPQGGESISISLPKNSPTVTATAQAISTGAGNRTSGWGYAYSTNCTLKMFYTASGGNSVGSYSWAVTYETDSA